MSVAKPGPYAALGPPWISRISGTRCPATRPGGVASHASTWLHEGEGLVDWLCSLHRPVGIVAVSDARARQLLQACQAAGLAVPDEVAIVGIDNDPLARALAQVPLTSVIQGTHAMGHAAARLLHEMLHGRQHPPRPVLVPPAGINVMASSKRDSTRHPHVMRALHFIRQHACEGLKTEQVARYVGISRSLLESQFRRELGRGVHDEVLRSKLDAAKSMLADEPVPITDVALRCGFSSVQYMSAVFRRELQCTPGQYRGQYCSQERSSPGATVPG